jgi:hypothetical protein
MIYVVFLFEIFLVMYMSVKLQDNNGSACSFLLVSVCILKYSEKYAHMKCKVSSVVFLILKMEFLFLFGICECQSAFGTLLCIFSGVRNYPICVQEKAFPCNISCDHLKSNNKYHDYQNLLKVSVHPA